MAVSKKLKGLYMGFFDGLETACANLISNFIELRCLHKFGGGNIPVSLKKSVKEYWSKYKKISPRWAWYYVKCNGMEDSRYIPNTLYYTKIDQHFNQRKLGWGFNDKNYYSRIFAGIKQPKTVVRNISGIFLDEDYHLISKEDAIRKILEEGEVICKPSLESGSGRSIVFWKADKDKENIARFLNDTNEKDYIVQAIIVQHPELDKVHKGSVNTIRITTLLMPERVYVLSSVLRMGVNESRIDNATAGGITAGITEDGFLKEFATTYYSGEKLYKHPQGLVFKGFEVPSYDKALCLAVQCASIIPHFRLVSWDIAIDVNGDAILIESNMRKGSINFHQFNNGPLFGDLTERVLNEVFQK